MAARNGGLLNNYFGTVVVAFSKPASQVSAIQVEILNILEDLLQTKALGLFNLQVEGDYAIIKSWATKKEEEHGNLMNG